MESNQIISPRNATIERARRNPVSWAINPMMGGPKRNPKKPMLLTAAMAAEGAMDLLLAESI
jgi:hypothetical protein